MQTAKKHEESGFSLIMDQVIQEMEGNAERFIKDKEELLPYQYVKEFRTVHLGYGRRTEKTRYIQSRAASSDLILIHSGAMKPFYKNQKADVVVSGAKMDVDSLTKRTIWVDEPSLHGNLHKVLKSLIDSYDQTVIMVGS